jgi:hypothetical protein
MVLNYQLILEVAVLKSELCFYPLTPAPIPTMAPLINDVTPRNQN